MHMSKSTPVTADRLKIGMLVFEPPFGLCNIVELYKIGSGMMGGRYSVGLEPLSAVPPIVRFHMGSRDTLQVRAESTVMPDGYRKLPIS